VDSTNRHANSLIRETNVSEGTVILADHQVRGKGQAGNYWHSEKNSNLLFSIILRPDSMLAEKQFYLSMCISNGLVMYISSIAGGTLIKWPNDILVKEKKIAGILIENTLMGNMLLTSVIGIGLNVNQKSFPEKIPNPVSLCMISGNDFSLPEVLNDLLSMLTIEVEELYGNRPDLIRTTYLNNLWKLNEWAEYEDSAYRFEGRITDVADTGELIVMLRNGEMRQYGFKEIMYV
jgi:BirA family biotin operon repressor/biotin-[acetyl-CoA-carboxylase] ligase